MRVAFYGRVSTDDAQDPSLSIPRQLAKCEQVLEPIGEKVTVTFWDVESGRKALEQRGKGKRDWTAEVSVPRLGGLPELLASVKEGAIDMVIVESIDRLSRMTADGTRIERELEERDVALFAADEPLNSSATSILTRRVKQGVAEWYVRDLMERSRAGMEESVRQGWHTGGRAPYGYQLEPHPHPNPKKAREGRKKHRLILDPVAAPIVLMIFTDYAENGMGLGSICEKLNRDLDRYPPPRRNGKDVNELVQTWSKSQLQSMLRNPKYTGFNVWNRHDKRKGRPLVRPRQDWIWSPTPTHEVIVPKELFDAIEERAQRNSQPPNHARPKRYPAHPRGQGRRLYVLRGRVRCGLCGRRMEGSHQKGSNWYRCQYVSKRGLAGADAAGHPRVLGIKEDVILNALREFMAERLFGPERLRLLADELAASVGGEAASNEADCKRLETEKKKIDGALRRQALRLEEHDDPEHPVVKLAKERIEELSAQGESVAQALAELESQRPEGPSAEQIEAMLADVPDLSEALVAAEGEELAELLDAFDVAISYDKPRRKLELSASITSDFLSESEATAATEDRSQGSYIAGAGFEPATFGL
jgi:site-specific DNA recombinase